MRTTRDKRGDYLALHVSTRTRRRSRPIARDAREVHFSFARFGKIRVTFLFREVPTRAVLQLLGDVGDVNLQDR